MSQGRILIISLGELKETIFTLPLLYVLKQHDYEVEYLTSEKGFEIVNKNPLINRVHLAPIEQWAQKMPYWGIFDDLGEVNKKLQKRNFDIAIDCQRTFRSLFLFGQCGAKRRLTYSNAIELSSFGGTEFIDSNSEYKNTNLHQVELNLNFARYLRLKTNEAKFVLPDAKYSSKLKMDKFLNFPEEKPLIVISPDMSKNEMAWHPKNWINLLSNIPEKYNIAIVGTAQDNILACKMSHKNLINLCGKTTFEDLRYILSHADILLSNNIETSAIAWAMNKDKIITISTNISPTKFNPYNLNSDKKYITLAGNLNCQPCNKIYCEHSSFKCSHYPTVETVLNSLR